MTPKTLTDDPNTAQANDHDFTSPRRAGRRGVHPLPQTHTHARLSVYESGFLRLRIHVVHLLASSLRGVAHRFSSPLRAGTSTP